MWPVLISELAERQRVDTDLLMLTFSSWRGIHLGPRGGVYICGYPAASSLRFIKFVCPGPLSVILMSLDEC